MANTSVTSRKYKLVTVTVGTVVKSLRSLIADAEKTLPTNSPLIEVIINPAAAITITDADTGSSIAISASKSIAACEVLDNVGLSCAANTVSVVLELFLD